MDASPPPPDPEWPSFDVIKDELDREELALAGRSASLDTRAGLLLATAGLLIGLRPDPPNVWTLLSVLAATGAAACSIGVVWPRMGGGISPGQLRSRYIHLPEAETAWRLLDSRIVVYEEDERRLLYRARLHRGAGQLIVVSMLFCLLSLLPEVDWRSVPGF